MNTQKNMENEYFHLFVVGKTSRDKKDGKTIREFSKFISADDLGYIKNMAVDQNAFMFHLIASCENVEELKSQIKFRYNNTVYSKAIKSGKEDPLDFDNVYNPTLIDEIDEVRLVVHNRYVNGFDMNTYDEKKNEYSVVPFMFKESFRKNSSYGNGSRVGTVKDKTMLFAPYLIIKDTLFNLIERKDILSKNKSYGHYYNTIIGHARDFLESTITRIINGYEEALDNSINKMLANNPDIDIERNNNGDYYVVYTNEFNQKCRERIENTKFNSESFKRKKRDLEKGKKRLGEYQDIEDDEEFVIKVLTDDAVLKCTDLRENSIKFYVYLAQLSNQIKLTEGYRVLNNELEKILGEKNVFLRKFRTTYGLNDLDYELMAISNIKDFVEFKLNYLLFKRNNVVEPDEKDPESMFASFIELENEQEFLQAQDKGFQRVVKNHR